MAHLSEYDKPKPVLVVEDSEVNMLLLETYFQSFGIDYECAFNAREALAKCAKTDYSAFLLDMHLPDADGPELAGKIKEIKKHAVIIIQTADNSPDSIISTMRLGIFDYILKPLNAALLKETILRALEISHLRDLQVLQANRYRHELSKVREIQSLYLPDFKSLSSFDVNCCILPAEDLSGDFVDAFECGGKTVTIVCDVNGHGLASAYIGNELRSLFRILYRDGMTSSQIIENVNKSVTSRTINPHYLSTIIACVIDNSSGEMNLSSAGHPPMLHYKASTSGFAEINPRGTILSFDCDSRYSEVSVMPESGDYLIIYTDGITEAHDDDMKMYGLESLKNAFVESASENASEKSLDVISSVFEFTNFRRQEDDMTLLLFRKR